MSPSDGEHHLHPSMLYIIRMEEEAFNQVLAFLAHADMPWEQFWDLYDGKDET